MLGLDDWIAGISGGGAWMPLVVALLLGIRHATDPDHLTAVATLMLSDQRHGARRANLLGLFWGLGHGLTLVACGLPVILFRQYLPEWVQLLAELCVGLLIAGLALRLLWRWHTGYFHVHPHSHGPVRHAHPHAHEREPSVAHASAHAHPHAEAAGRTPWTAFGIGLVHGIGGSAGAGILLLAAVPGPAVAVVALLLFAGATAASMAVASSAFGYALARGPVIRRLKPLVPILGALSLLFGVWYSFTALNS